MLKRVSVLVIGILICALTSVYAIAGIGVHYGYDLSVHMADATNEPAVFDSLKILNDGANIPGTVPANFINVAAITGKDLPIYINRSGFARTPMDFGGKFYVDCIPFLDAIEVSANFGLWQYKGELVYPKSLSWKTTQPTDPATPFINRVDITYDTLLLTLDKLNMPYWGLKNTPYAKLNTDLTIRKNLITLPPLVNILKVYAGGGFSINFATPVLSAGLVKDALGTDLNALLPTSGLNTQLFGQADIQKKIMNQIMNNLITPHYGCHIVLGTALKFPVFPVGFYVDGKFMIPFGKLDKNVNITGTGLLLNAGVTLGI
ncbi:MAG: hypothetical protein PHC61_13260 [Chitinivibrionales bacterium]|nr:hypothetical protein [Chitinivibrionales bacterium]